MFFSKTTGLHEVLCIQIFLKMEDERKRNKGRNNGNE